MIDARIAADPGDEEAAALGALEEYNIEASIDPGEVVNIDLVLDRPGTFAMYCSEFCSALHLEMMGYLMVEPSSR